MTVFIDTSGIYALFDAGNADYPAALEVWDYAAENKSRLITSNYVVVETCALLHRRFGITAVREFQEKLQPIITIEWVDEPIHNAGINGALMSSKRGPSLVNCVSFAIMRKLGIDTVFAFDHHFSEQGFKCLPSAE